MYCPNCGEQIDDKAVVCPKCGVAIRGKAAVSPDDAPSTGFSVLCFFIPVVGLILYLLWHETSPLKAKSCGKGAIIGVIVGVVCSIIMICAYSCLLSSVMMSVL